MRICVLFNPRAGSAGQMDALRDALAAVPGLEVRELAPDADLPAAASQAARDGFDVVAVAGGDGTVNAGANGLLDAGADAALAVLPLGTGNDFCRTLSIPLDPLAAVGLLTGGTVRRLDAVRVEGGRTNWMVNAATGGFSGKVAESVTPELKAAWGPLAYLRGAVGPAADLPQYTLVMRFDGGPPDLDDEVLNVVVANGRTAAGGLPVAPTANPEDGLLDVVIVRAGGTLDLSLIAARLMHGDYLDDEFVSHRTARRFEVTPNPPMAFSIDGELCEGERFVFEVKPGALRAVVGPGYEPVPPPEPPVEDEDDEPTVAVPKTLRQRLWGLLAGGLLLVRRTPAASAVGLALIAVAVLTFTWIADGVSGKEWDAFNDRLRQAEFDRRSPALDRLAWGLTWLGYGVGSTLIVGGLLALYLARKHYLTAATLLALILGLTALEWTLKPLFAVARPTTFDPLDTPPSYSFPSGHALRGVGVGGFVAAVAAARAWRLRRPGWWLVAVLAVAVGLGVCWSRVYLGAHNPADVLAGGVAAVAWLTACLLARHYAMRRAGRGGTGSGLSPLPLRERVARPAQRGRDG